MKDKPQHFIQGRAAGPIRKPCKNRATHPDGLAKRERQGAVKTLVYNLPSCRAQVCAGMCALRG